MTRCEYCGGEIDVLSRKFIWIDKDSDFALHKKCSREAHKRLPKMVDELEKFHQKYQHLDVSTLSNSEFCKYLNDYVNILSVFGHGSATISKEKKIRNQEDFIEMLKKINFPDKEKLLTIEIEELKKLKNDNRAPPESP